jgi:hypothetical protein
VPRRKVKIDKRLQKELRKKLDLDQYATHDEVKRNMEEQAEAERKRKLWNSLSPQIKLKLAKHLQERKKANAKK